MASRRRRRRKLLTGSLQIIISDPPCDQFCNPNKNSEHGLPCPLLCLPLCFSTCRRTLPPLPPLHPPPLPPLPPLHPPPLPPPPDFISRDSSSPVKHFQFQVPIFLPMLAAGAALFFLFMTGYVVVRNWRRRGSGGGDSSEEDGAVDERMSNLAEDAADNPIWHIRTVGLGQSMINRITVSRYNQRGEDGDCSNCCVCLSEFEEGERVRVLPKCNHAFHIHCIDTWLASHTNCPICRAPILVPEATISAAAAAPGSRGRGGMIEEGLEGESRSGVGESRIDELKGGSLLSSMNNGAETAGIRRSVSMDLVPQNGEMRPVTGKSSSSSSSSSLMGEVGKRSLSCSGKIMSSRYNKS
ncbi:unnamed protein product [Cuscuta epithymum]|uniref:RING-type E3 ubiquitin transferase n=1 Tax=Cuscuta epithymum TaxID=186058 RepID=A0AAV0CSP4_9ASTE|nr:unnamed protein product [Cuscuta epithymum]